ncbi:hypothetical protein SLOPH_229 [Spraguea lophii 42_110]|uniref:Uncharacterized protein n=1 Tax=Spraguea lophii (strain 42_110) TaxID=1358809 RepID=S7W956_SPRLO|nr:hypothetical protein SLOPH_229 [Spraguea lophii 42_110]
MNMKEVFYHIENKRNAEAIEKIIKNNVNVGTKIIINDYKDYSMLSNPDYIHGTINHIENFVHPQNKKIHIQNIEIGWRYLKKYLENQHIHNINGLITQILFYF